EKSGNLDAIIGFASLIKIVQDSISDTVVDRTSEILSNLGLLCEREPQLVGLIGLIRALRDPDVKKAIGILLNIAKELGKQI
ncbi:MAG: DUF1641 domain-containing protein, partial [Archaeoglobaceae archaeon]